MNGLLPSFRLALVAVGYVKRKDVTSVSFEDYIFVSCCFLKFSCEWLTASFPFLHFIMLSFLLLEPEQSWKSIISCVV